MTKTPCQVLLKILEDNTFVLILISIYAETVLGIYQLDIFAWMYPEDFNAVILKNTSFCR